MNKGVPKFISLYLAIVLLVTASVCGKGEEPRIGKTRPGRLRLVYGSDAAFDESAARYFPGLTGSPHYAEIKATSLMLVNDAPEPVRVAAVEWKIESASGDQSTQFTLIGDVSDDTAVIGNGSASLVSPLSHLEAISGPDRKRQAAFLQIYARSDLVKPLLTAKSITGIIDGVIFASNIVMGPDTYGLARLYACERKAAVSEAQALKPEVQNLPLLNWRLNEDSTLKKVGDDDCAEGGRQEAIRLLSIEKTKGIEALSQAIAETSAAAEPSLRRLPFFRPNPPRSINVELPAGLVPDKSGLFLVKADDADLSPVLDAEYPGIRTDATLQPFLPLMAYLRNEGSRNILAFTLAFTVVPLHGQPETLHITFEHKADLPGRISDVAPILERHESRVIGPWFNWDTLKWKEHPNTAKFAGLARFRMVTEIPSAKRVDIALDAVVFDDNSIAGPDTYDLRDRFECQRNGERAEGIAISQMFAENLPAARISDQLQADIAQGRDAIGKNDRADLEIAARATRASRFAQILKNRGADGLKIAADRLARYDVTTLQAGPEPERDTKAIAE
jgi:hypothetical protein